MDGSQVGAVVDALFLEQSQMLFGFLEVHVNTPAQRVDLQHGAVLKMTSCRQKDRPVVLAQS